MTKDQKDRNGNYNIDSYHFWYDWRKDPMEVADELHAFIEGSLAASGKTEVCLASRCLGTNIVMAYLAKYGMDRVYGVSIDSTVTNGSEFIGEAISGKFHVDADAITRMLNDSNALGRLDVSPFLMATLDLLNKSGAIDGIVGFTKEKLYAKLVEGVTSALALSTFFTMPCYWACVKPEDLEDAKYYVFGPEGSAKREQYAGLIEKIDNYHTNVRAKLPELLNGIVDSGRNFGLIAKYGFQIVPICQSSQVVGDQYASLNSSSFGATTSTIFTTLEEDYIAARIAEGKGKYISPDRMVDASTCMFPEYTWFLKNVGHSDWTNTENALIYTVAASDLQYTVDDFVTTQFMVNVDGKIVPMTEENCHTESWEVKEEPTNINPHVVRVFRFLTSFVTWFRYLIDFVKSRLAA